MRKLILAISALALAGSAALADPIADRQALMKANGRHAGILGRMTRGAEPFDAAKVNAGFDQWAETAAKFPGLFPESTKGAGDSRALPTIWTERAKFEATVAKFAKDVADNRAKAASGVDGLKTALAAVGQNCASCHENFRKPQ